MIYVDIDGTLTIPPKDYKYDGSPMGKWREPHLENIAKVKRLIAEGKDVILWTGGGKEYAKAFADKYNIKPLACLGKPKYLVDDNSFIRPPGRIKVIDPRDFLKADI